MIIETNLHRLGVNEDLSIGWIPQFVPPNLLSSLPYDHIHVIEVRFSDLRDDDQRYDRAIEKRSELLRRFAKSEVMHLLVVEPHGVSPVQVKLRDARRGSAFAKKETVFVRRSDGGGFLVSRVPLEQENIAECSRIASDRRRAFITVGWKANSFESQSAGLFLDDGSYPRMEVLIDRLGKSFTGFFIMGSDQGINYINCSLYCRDENSARFTTELTISGRGS